MSARFGHKRFGGNLNNVSPTEWLRRKEICLRRAAELRAAGSIKHAEDFEEAAAMISEDGKVKPAKMVPYWRPPARNHT